MLLLGSLIAEIYFPKKFRCLGDEAPLSARYRNAVELVKRESRSLPSAVRHLLVRLLLQPDQAPFSLGPSDRFEAISETGLPLPSPDQILDSLLGCGFPALFPPLLHTIQAVESLAKELPQLPEEQRPTLADFLVKLVARRLSPLLHNCAEEELVQLAVPLYRTLLRDPHTAVQASWLLLDPLATILGPEKSREFFLDLILAQYRDSATAKHIKLYHRSFILVLIARFRTASFLDNFVNILVEAVGGHKDFLDNDPLSLSTLALPHTAAAAAEPEPAQPQAPTTNPGEGDIFMFEAWDSLPPVGGGGKANASDMDAELVSCVAQNLLAVPAVDVQAPVVLTLSDLPSPVRAAFNGGGGSLSGSSSSVVQICKESLLWLANRLGPVLTARYLSKNLLRMLNLCFMPPEGLEPSESQLFPDQQIRLSLSMISGGFQAC
jgi:WD repeat-containing protein 81